MDRPHLEHETTVQCEAGSRALGKHIHYRSRTASARRKRTDLPGATEGWRELCCAPSVSQMIHFPTSSNSHRNRNVVAYTASVTPPMPFRFKSSNFRLQVPDLGFGSFVQNSKFFNNMSKTTTWRAIATTWYTLKTWMRRSIWGDRVCFLVVKYLQRY